MLVYGKNVFKEFVNNKKSIENVTLQERFNDNEILTMLENNKIKYKYAPKKEIDRLANGVHQGIIFYVSDYNYYSIDDLIDNKEDSFLVLLDHLEDPHNLGAIIRTCEAAGVDGIVLPKDRQVQINSTVMKTSVGTIDNVRIASVTNLVNTIKKLKENGYWIVGTSLKDSVDYRKIDYSGKIALIIGNEGSGISRLVENECDFIAKIPMYGKTNSLNASVAAGIMIYEVIRNRK